MRYAYASMEQKMIQMYLKHCFLSRLIQATFRVYLTIIPLARMASESIAHEAEAEWAIDSGAMRARAIIVLVKSNELVKNIETKQL